MRPKFILFLTLSIGCLSTAKGQKLHGIITNQENEKLSFVHILNTSNGEGNTSNALGYFTIQAEIEDSHLFSTVGYETFTLIVSNLSDTLKVQMIRDTTLLQEVTVYGSKYQEERKPIKLEGFKSPDELKPLKTGAIEFGNSLNDDPNMLPVFGLHMTINGPFSYFTKKEKEKRRLPKAKQLIHENILYHFFTEGEIQQFMCETFEIEKEEYLTLFSDFYLTNLQLFEELTTDELKANLIIYLSEKVE